MQTDNRNPLPQLFPSVLKVIWDKVSNKIGTSLLRDNTEIFLGQSDSDG